MSNTVSLEILVKNSFDKLYNEAKFQDIIIMDVLKDLLVDFEKEILQHTENKDTTEMEEAKEQAHDEGWYIGKDVGYDEGYEDGYKEAKSLFETEGEQ